MKMIRRSALARTISTTVANLIEPIAIAMDRIACRLAYLGRPLDQE